MMIRTSLSPRDVTPAAYLLPSAMSFRRRAATRGSTIPIRIPLLNAIKRLPSGVSSTASPGFTWASLRGFGRSVRNAKAVDVAFGDPIRRIERERGLVMLAGGTQLAELPERLGEPVLRLGIGAELEQALVRLDGLSPLCCGRVSDRLIGELALQSRLVDGTRGLGFDFGEGHEDGRPFG